MAESTIVEPIGGKNAQIVTTVVMTSLRLGLNFSYIFSSTSPGLITGGMPVPGLSCAAL